MSLEAKNEVEKCVLEYVLTHASAELMERISAEGKTIQGCWAYVTSYARTHATNSQYCMTDEEAFGLVMHYFEDEPEGATFKTEKQKQNEENARKTAAEEKRKEEERIAALTPEECEAEERAKAQAEAEREANEAECRKKELERKIREQAKAAVAKRKAELANAQMSFDF